MEVFVPADLSLIQGPYFRDLLDQPKAIEDTLEILQPSKPLLQIAKHMHKSKQQRIVLTGMGSSFHALHPLQIQLVQHGFSPTMVETSELVHYQNRSFDPHTLIIGVSQSGRSAEMIRLLQFNRGRASLLAVTNSPDSPLAQRSDALVLTRAGAEFSVSCKTYVTSLLALKFLGDVLCGVPTNRTQKELRFAMTGVSTFLASWNDHVRSLVDQLSGIRTLFLVGRGASLSAVSAGALIIKESTHFQAEGMSSAAFRHGPYDMLGPNLFVLVFAGPSKTRDLNQRLLDDIRAQKCKTGFVAGGQPTSAFTFPNVPESILPVLEILPVQMMTLALAALAGREPGIFHLATKITAIE
jgi:glutamine---fructose-6-phosphate transaminase (isomerizing)